MHAFLLFSSTTDVFKRPFWLYRINSLFPRSLGRKAEKLKRRASRLSCFSYLLRAALVTTLILRVDSREVGDDDRDRECDN